MDDLNADLKLQTSAKIDSLFESSSADALNEFLTLMEDTESPRQYLVWSLLSVAAALIGDNACFRRGPLHKVRANLYVILIGPPAAKKNSAINAAVDLVEGMTLNFGPTDTGGQRHGLMAALTGLNRRLGRLDKETIESVPAFQPYELSPRKPSDLFLVAPELGRLLGAASPEMANFMIDLWDRSPIDYQTKAGEILIRKPLGNMLGGTTPSSMAQILPANATDHGILTRMLFIYGDEPYKLVPLPPEQKEEWFELREQLRNRLLWIDRNRFDFRLSADAERHYQKLYPFIPSLEDPRMAPYKGRRGIMLMKVAMALAALRSDNTIQDTDILLGHELLKGIEPTMHKALEYFGKSKTFQGRMLIVNYLKNVPGKIATQAELLSAASSELTQREAQEALQNLESSGVIRQYGQSGKYVLNESIEIQE